MMRGPSRPAPEGTVGDAWSEGSRADPRTVCGFSDRLVGRDYLTVTVIFFMTTIPPDMAGRSAPVTLGNS